ncbi:MAG TPA: hypothetical protein VNO83_13240 [Pseudonocardia sp.]|nr:hypothetical protein [Pseudonocardia sp.]
MITIIVGGIALIAVLAVVVGIADSVQAPAWRRIARERRRIWEARQLETDRPQHSASWDKK